MEKKLFKELKERLMEQLEVEDIRLLTNHPEKHAITKELDFSTEALTGKLITSRIKLTTVRMRNGLRCGSIYISKTILRKAFMEYLKNSEEVKVSAVDSPVMVPNSNKILTEEPAEEISEKSLVPTYPVNMKFNGRLITISMTIRKLFHYRDLINYNAGTNYRKLVLKNSDDFAKYYEDNKISIYKFEDEVKFINKISACVVKDTVVLELMPEFYNYILTYFDAIKMLCFHPYSRSINKDKSKIDIGMSIDGRSFDTFGSDDHKLHNIIDIMERFLYLNSDPNTGLVTKRLDYIPLNILHILFRLNTQYSANIKEINLVGENKVFKSDKYTSKYTFLFKDYAVCVAVYDRNHIDGENNILEIKFPDSLLDEYIEDGNLFEELKDRCFTCSSSEDDFILKLNGKESISKDSEIKVNDLIENTIIYDNAMISNDIKILTLDIKNFYKISEYIRDISEFGDYNDADIEIVQIKDLAVLGNIYEKSIINFLYTDIYPDFNFNFENRNIVLCYGKMLVDGEFKVFVYVNPKYDTIEIDGLNSPINRYADTRYDIHNSDKVMRFIKNALVVYSTLNRSVNIQCNLKPTLFRSVVDTCENICKYRTRVTVNADNYVKSYPEHLRLSDANGVYNEGTNNSRLYISHIERFKACSDDFISNLFCKMEYLFKFDKYRGYNFKVKMFDTESIKQKYAMYLDKKNNILLRSDINEIVIDVEYSRSLGNWRSDSNNNSYYSCYVFIDDLLYKLFENTNINKATLNIRYTEDDKAFVSSIEYIKR